jgi:hypothetical protein
MYTFIFVSLEAKAMKLRNRLKKKEVFSSYIADS